MAAAEMPEADSAAHCECESDAEADTESAGFRPDASQVQHTTVNSVYLGFSRGFALLDSSAFGLPCVPAFTPHRLTSPPSGHVACLGLAKSMLLAGCI